MSPAEPPTLDSATCSRVGGRLALVGVVRGRPCVRQGLAVKKTQERLDVLPLSRAGQDEMVAAILHRLEERARPIEGPDLPDEPVELLCTPITQRVTEP